jgi:hypothetical protein
LLAPDENDARRATGRCGALCCTAAGRVSASPYSRLQSCASTTWLKQNPLEVYLKHTRGQ